MEIIYQAFGVVVLALMAWLSHIYMKHMKNAPQEPVDTLPEPQNSPVEDLPVKVVDMPDPLTTMLPWDMKGKLSHANWHNVRVICDEEGLTHEEKEDLTATVWGESDFDVHALCNNYGVRNVGTKENPIWQKYLASSDHGICQWNNKYHPDVVKEPYTPNPDREVRRMCHYWKMGELYKDWWIAHKNGRYLQFKGKKL